jgi:hypothetical protein
MGRRLLCCGSMSWEQEHGGHEDKDEQNSPMHKSLLSFVGADLRSSIPPLIKMAGGKQSPKGRFLCPF